MDRIDGARTFVAAAEAGSFAGAGARLGVSGKLVSKWIGEMERRLGHDLFYRTTRALSLTEAGERFLPGARKLLAALEEAEAALAAAPGELTGRLRITAPTTFGEIFVADALAAFGAQNPALSMDLHLTDRLVDVVGMGFDLAIRIGGGRDSALVSRRLGVARIMLAASPGYLAGHGAPRRLEELSQRECVIDTNHPTPGRWTFRASGEDISAPVSGRFRVDSASAALRLAAAGAGIVRCPDIFMQPWLESGALVPVLTDFPGPEREIAMLRPATVHRPPKTQAAMDFLQARFRRLQRAAKGAAPP